MLQKQGFFSTLFLYRTQVNYSGSANSSSFLAKGLTLYSGQYQLVNNANNQPYSNVKYIVTYPDGRTIEGVTDENGMTEKLEKQKMQKILKLNF